MRKNKKKIIALLLVAAVIFTSINLTDISGTDEKETSKSDKKLNSFAEEVIELTADDDYEGEGKYQTKRLIVTSDTDDFQNYNATDVINYGNIFVLSYDTEDACRDAYKKLSKDKTISSVEVDAVMEIESKEKITDKDIEKAMKISSYSDNDEKTAEILDNYDPTNIGNYEEEDINNVDTYLAGKNLSQKKDIVVAIIDSGLNKDAVDEDRYTSKYRNFSGEGDMDDITDGNGHGTDMAEIITSQTKNNIKVMPVKTVNSEGKCSILSAYMGIRYAMDNGADIINVSLNTVASDKSVILEDTIREADKKGIKVVVSAGNDTDDSKYHTPGNVEEAFVISAANEHGTLAGYSNFGDFIDYASLGNYKESEGTSIAAANFSACLAKLMGADVKNVNSVLDSVAEFDENSEKNFFTGKGYIGVQKTITDTGVKKTVITGSIAPASDIRSLKDGKWKELTKKEFDKYIKGSGLINTGAFLSTLSKEDFKEAVEKSEILKHDLTTTNSDNKKIRKNKYYEEALLVYSKTIEQLKTQGYNIADGFLTTTCDLKFGGKVAENGSPNDGTSSYINIVAATIDGGKDLNKSDLTLDIIYETHNDSSVISLSEFDHYNSNHYLLKTTSSEGQIYANAVFKFKAEIAQYYACSHGNTEKTATSQTQTKNASGTFVNSGTAGEHRLSFNDYVDNATENFFGSRTDSWSSLDNAGKQDMSLQCNIVHLGCNLINDAKTVRTLHSSEASLYFKVARPQRTLTLIPGSGISSINPESKAVYRGETISRDAFTINVDTGYELTDTTPASWVMTSDITETINATPIKYNFNYYHGNGDRLGMTLDCTTPGGAHHCVGAHENPHTVQVEYNSAFNFEPENLFEGHYNLTYKTIPTSDTVGYNSPIQRFVTNTGATEGFVEKKYEPTILNGSNGSDLGLSNSKNDDTIKTKISSWHQTAPLENYFTPGESATCTVASDRDLYGVWDNGKYPTLPTPSMTGFTFKGWYKSYEYDSKLRGSNGTGVQVTSGADYDELNDLTLYAKWERNEHTVTYNYGTNGGYQRGNTSTKTRTEKVLYDWPIDTTLDAEKSTDNGTYSQEDIDNNLAPGVYDSMNNPDGWEFIGWSENKDAKPGDGVSKIYGKAVRNQYFYSYKDKNDGSGYKKDETGRYMQVSSLKSPSPEDFITEEFLMPDRDVTLYAIYQKKINFHTTDAATTVLNEENPHLSADKTKNNTVSETIYGNNSGITVTIPTISKCDFGIYTDQYSPWTTLGWAESYEPTQESVKYDTNKCGTTLTLYEDKYLYAVYKRDAKVTFISHGTQSAEGDKIKKDIQSFTQYVNMAYPYDRSTFTITAPSLPYKYNGDSANGLWSQNYWINAENINTYKNSELIIQKTSIKLQKNPSSQDDINKKQKNEEIINNILLANGGTVTSNKFETFYALYDRNIHVSYTYYNGNSKVSNEKQEVRQYVISCDTVGKAMEEAMEDEESPTATPIPTQQEDLDKIDINSYSNPHLITKDIKKWNAYPVSKYWSKSSTNLSKAYDSGVEISINGNINLYAVCERNIKAIFKDYTESVSGGIQTREEEKKQLVNAASEDTREYISFNEQTKRYFTDERSDKSYRWDCYKWTTDTEKAKQAKNDIQTDPFTIRDTTTYYAVYSTTYRSIFTSINGSLSYTQTLSGTAHLNTNKMAEKQSAGLDPIDAAENPTVTTPSEKKCDINARTWTAKGWTTKTEATAAVEKNQNQSIVLTGDIHYYGRYDANCIVKFIDYNGTQKTTRNVTASQSVNASDLMPSDASFTTLVQNTCTLDGRTWTAKGWTRATDSYTAEVAGNTSFTSNEEDTFYGVYDSSVTLDFVTYNNTAKPNSVIGQVSMNSSNKDRPKKASTTIQSNPQSTDGWNGTGWTTKTEASELPETTGGSVYEFDKNTTLYGVYNKTIKLKYMCNDGTNNQFGETQESGVQINASNINNVSPANFTITTDVPSRSSCSFMYKWGDSSKNPTNSYTPGLTYSFKADTTLYAQWEIPTIDKKVTIQWVDNNDVNKARPDKVYLKLYRDGTVATSYIVSSMGDTIAQPSSNTTIGTGGVKVDINSETNEFNFTFAGLQRYASDGHAYNYVVREEPFESLVNGLSYTISYPSDTVIKNTLINSGGVQMDVNINWDDGLNAWHIRPSSVILSLIQTDPDTNEKKTIKVASVKPEATKENQIHSFLNVPVLNGNMNMYKYEVREDRIAGYSTTYGTQETINGIITFPVYNVCTGLPTLYGENYIIFSADAFRQNGNQATGSDYLNIDIEEEEPVLITLRQIHKVWNGMGAGATESYDNNTYMHNDVNGTDVSYNVIVSPRVDTKLISIPFGRYELEMHNHAYFDLKNFSAANNEKINADLDTINGKQYVTFSARYSSGAIVKLHANILIANWRGYTARRNMYQPMDYSFIQVRMPGIYDNMGTQVKTWNLMKIDGDMTVNGTTFALASATHIDGELLIDNSITTIAARGLVNQKDMLKLTLPDNLKEVRGEAFAGCSRLRIVTYLGVQYVDNDALKDAFRRNGVTFTDSAFNGVSLGY